MAPCYFLAFYYPLKCTFTNSLIKWVQILHSSLLSLHLLFLKFKCVYILSVLTYHPNTSGPWCFVWFSCVCSLYVVILHLEAPQECQWLPPTFSIYFTRSQEFHYLTKPQVFGWLIGVIERH